ncbi:unnamed protein product [Leptidea sinapis]|uniref:Ionotropic glutamate receptor C-terminal domain-containing protein n=1 Tax=Leptidea sinapis TaxID=189913 RepID=A0A5E4PMV9_9NEOP|nr:unnamed protein product [Leptidea sinapis]
MSEFFKLEHLFGCWTRRKVEMPINSFSEGFVCEAGCHNVSLHTKFRANNLGTCVGFQTYSVKYSEKEYIENLRLFEDKSINFNKFPMRAYAVEIRPFLVIKEESPRNYTFHQRDGMIWNTIAELMNFTIDVSSNKHPLKTFEYEKNIVHIYAFSLRKLDILIFPLYQFDIMILNNDNTVPIADSGVCLMAHRAVYETIVFDHRLIINNLVLIIEFSLCFLFTWITFIVFNFERYQNLSFDRVGKDLVNSFRTVLSISLYKPPKQSTFRIFLAVAIWCFFIINFTSQAAIISFFSVYKKGKEIDTFEQILEKNYNIEGISSPDVLLPDDEERFRNINSKMVAVQNMIICPSRMLNDSKRFCILDCAMGRYLERNLLNEKGQQYLHIARQDRIHSHYLQMIFHKHSPMTKRYNKYIQILLEGGIINKWIEYRFHDIKEDLPIKALGMKDMEGIFTCYCILLALCGLVFIIEIALGKIKFLIYRKKCKVPKRKLPKQTV